MTKIITLKLMVAAVCTLLALSAFSAQEKPEKSDEVVQFATDQPAPPRAVEQEVAYSDSGPYGPVRIVTNVPRASLTVIRPKATTATKSAVVILPGGGFQVLGWDIEGTEAGQWFADRGVTAFVLKYRVRKYVAKPGETPDLAAILGSIAPAYAAGVEDATRAISHLRENATEYGIDPGRIGMMGFSAGANITIGCALGEDSSARPNFAALIYPIWDVSKLKVPVSAPPIFVAAAKDDWLGATTSTQVSKIWKEAARSVELHLYEQGGHGFGMRKTGRPSDSWTTAFEAWLSGQDVFP